jgi:uncharacterized protein (UPF0333 family)
MLKLSISKKDNMHKNQKGFAHIESLLLLIIVVIITGIGWYVWHAQSQANKSLADADNASNSIISSKKKKQSSSNGTSSTQASPTALAQIPTSVLSANPSLVTITPNVVNNYITINEWNVRFKQTGVITITYAHDDNDKNHLAAFFSSTQLASKDRACKAEFYPAGFISRVKVADLSGKLPSKDLYKQVGDYFYFYQGPKAKCSELKEIQDLQNQTADAVKAFLQSLEAVTN